MSIVTSSGFVGANIHALDNVGCIRLTAWVQNNPSVVVLGGIWTVDFMLLYIDFGWIR